MQKLFAERLARGGELGPPTLLTRWGRWLLRRGTIRPWWRLPTPQPHLLLSLQPFVARFGTAFTADGAIGESLWSAWLPGAVEQAGAEARQHSTVVRVCARHSGSR
ncbi:hypothetical protein GCM10028799_50140 [Kribbella italica]